jgi:TM2 domain-containing membrane protein YozV
MTWPQGNEQYRAQPEERARELPPPPYMQPPPPPGYAQPMMQAYQQVQGRSAAVGVIASLFIPGLGSMLAGRGGKGAAILVSYFVAILLCFFLIGFILSPAVWIYGMVAANNDTHKWNREHGLIS